MYLFCGCSGGVRQQTADGRARVGLWRIWGLEFGQ